MKLPNRGLALIARDKLTDYVLNVAHRRGGPKARLRARFGYHAGNAEQSAADIRTYHVGSEVEMEYTIPYGVRYEIRAPLRTPSGRNLTIRTIWQIDEGTDFPRRITLFPD
ncbi:MAG: hypothetical protein AUJ92_03280 [Armatimonadetes bacterium CG2_30_59_28]|nr:MAG: hypothetical protein AUJ92_03280 [Armatimonadetes bacterium CG2_30_59_28]